MSFKNHLASLALVLMVMVIQGCDPGCGYAPVDGKGSKVKVWSRDINSVHFEHQGFDDLIPISDFRGQLTVTNDSDSDVVLVSARLETNGKTVEASPPREEDRKSWLVAKKQT